MNWIGISWAIWDMSQQTNFRAEVYSTNITTEWRSNPVFPPQMHSKVKLGAEWLITIITNIETAGFQRFQLPSYNRSMIFRRGHSSVQIQLEGLAYYSIGATVRCSVRYGNTCLKSSTDRIWKFWWNLKACLSVTSGLCSCDMKHKNSFSKITKQKQQRKGCHQSTRMSQQSAPRMHHWHI